MSITKIQNFYSISDDDCHALIDVDGKDAEVTLVTRGFWKWSQKFSFPKKKVAKVFAWALAVSIDANLANIRRRLTLANELHGEVFDMEENPS